MVHDMGKLMDVTYRYGFYLDMDRGFVRRNKIIKWWIGWLFYTYERDKTKLTFKIIPSYEDIVAQIKNNM